MSIKRTKLKLWQRIAILFPHLLNWRKYGNKYSVKLIWTCDWCGRKNNYNFFPKYDTFYQIDRPEVKHLCFQCHYIYKNNKQ